MEKTHTTYEDRRVGKSVDFNRILDAVFKRVDPRLVRLRKGQRELVRDGRSGDAEPANIITYHTTLFPPCER